MSTLITNRFIKCHNALLEAQKVRSSSMLAKAIGVARQSLNRIVSGDSEVTVQILERFVEVFQASPNFLLLGEGPMFIEYIEKLPFAKIAYIPVKAYAGYAEQFDDESFVDQMSYFSLPDPRFQEGIFRCFEVEGDSMLPTFESGDKVVCSQVYHIYLEQLLKNDGIYVIVSIDSIFLKRVNNLIKQEKAVQLKSDNDCYPDIMVPVNDIKQVWRVETRISEDFKKSLSNRPVYLKQ